MIEPPKTAREALDRLIDGAAEGLSDEEVLAAIETPADRDLRRLEASLQRMQREGTTAGRPPRAAPLPPVSGLLRVGPEGLRQRSEQFINGVRVPPSLAPDRVRRPPMRERRDNLRGPLRILVVSVIAAPIAYYFSVGSFTSTSEGGRESGLARGPRDWSRRRNFLSPRRSCRRARRRITTRWSRPEPSWWSSRR